MEFKIILDPSIKEMVWRPLIKKASKKILTSRESAFYKKLKKCLRQLSSNPKHPGLHTHEIVDLSHKYGIKIWQSYLENNTPGAKRIYWHYGPDKKEITIIGIDIHPEDTVKACKQLRLKRTKR